MILLIKIFKRSKDGLHLSGGVHLNERAAMINVEWVQQLEAVRFLLTKREQEIVEYLEVHFDALPQLSIRDLAEATNTSRSTVHRFCQKMGYKGFKAFKQAMNQYSRSLKIPLANISPSKLTPKIASDTAITKAKSSFELFQKGFLVDIQALQHTTVTIAEPQLTRIVDLILQAQTLYCVGYETGCFPTRFLAERLCRLRRNVQIAVGEQRYIKDTLFSMTDHDLLILFGYHKDFNFDLQLFEFAQKRGAKTILITNYPTSPLIARAEETLLIRRGVLPFKHSMAVPMTVVNNLLLAVEFALGDKREIYLQEWDEFYENHNNVRNQ